MTPETILVSFSASPKGSRCPFGNAVSFDLRPGGCVWLQGPSGRGKSPLAGYLCNILPQSILDKLQISVSCQWNPSLKPSERCGVLFQQTTLLDELTLAGNLAVALDAVGCPLHDRDKKIKQFLDIVGLSYHQDADKMPTELSGGMGRRASLALQLAQNKHVIFLDEPFAGLDFDVASSIAQELVYLRKTKGTAFILISHEPELAEKVMDASCNGNTICKLHERNDLSSKQVQHPKRNLYHGTRFLERFWDKLLDYFIWSLPLILLAFLACGLAIAMLTCETLKRLDVADPVLKLVDKEIRPLIKMLTGQEATTLHMLGVRMKVSSLLNQTVPPAKATLYAVGMTKLFVLEIGPLLTALLLCGRIGGSYAGKLATMQATSQINLLKTLGMSPMAWSLYPAALAVSIAGPLLTSIGTLLALFAASVVGSFYGIGDLDGFWEQARSNIFPTLRLSGFVKNMNKDDGGITTIPSLLARFFSSIQTSSFYDGFIVPSNLSLYQSASIHRNYFGSCRDVSSHSTSTNHA